MRKIKFLLAVITASAIFASCKNDSDTSRLYLQVNIKAGSNALAYNTDYTAAGYTIQFNVVKFYLSQFVIQTGGADSVVLNDLYMLEDADSTNRYYIGELSNTTYTGIRFGLGVDSTRNDINGSNAIPAYDYPDGHPLNAANNMYWSWNPGYIWMKLEGRIDLNSNGNFSDPGETFALHTGLNSSYRTISRPYAFSLTGEDKTLKMDADILQFFNGYDLANQLNAHAMSTTSPEYPYVTELVNNANLVFGVIYE